MLMRLGGKRRGRSNHEGQAMDGQTETPIESMLTDQQKDVLRLRYVDKLGVAGAAKQLGVSVRLVKFETARAFRAIRLCKIRYGVVHLDFLQD